MIEFKKANFSNPTLQNYQKAFEEQYKPIFDEAKKEYVPSIRQFLNSYMGLKLSGNNRSVQIPIYLVPSSEGFIRVIEEQYGNFNFDDISKLNRYIETAENVFPVFHKNDSANELNKTIEIAKSILQSMNPENIIDNIYQFDQEREPGQDIFGAYYPERGIIDIYMAECILFCDMHNLNLKKFLSVILAHELAHGYSHLGGDKDGNDWEDYQKVDPVVHESIANYFNWEYIKQKYNEEQELHKIKSVLDFHQPPYYRYYRDWSRSYEHIFNAHIVARRNSIRSYHEFFGLIHEAELRIS